MHIDKRTPIPTTSGRGRSPVYPLDRLAVGESFLCPPEVRAHNMRMLVQYHQKKHSKRYTTRTTPEGLRVWRTA